MDTILEVIGLADQEENSSLLINLIDDEIDRSRTSGDLLGMGEWLASKLLYVDEESVEELFCKIVTLWGSPIELNTTSSSIKELISNINEYVPEDLAIAFIATKSRMKHSPHKVPPGINDIVFRIKDQFSTLFELKSQRPRDIITSATAKLETLFAELQFCVDAFTNTNCVTAKTASIEVVKKGHQLKRIALVRERPILSDLDILLGTTFRKFCECCEQQNTKGIINRAPGLNEQVKKILTSSRLRENSVIWNLIIEKTARHVLNLIDEGIRRSKIEITPSLRLASSNLKLDLFRLRKEMTFSNRLENQGRGRALNINMIADLSREVGKIRILEPNGPFEIDGSSEQIVTFGIEIYKQRLDLEIPIHWKCETITGQAHVDEDNIKFRRQIGQPDWDKLLEDPPYSINPIKIKEKLFGRDEILNSLLLNASGGTSTFLWGQKRVGKTSILQVLAGMLQKMSDFVCLVFRMGELGPLHEGQIGHKIAERLYANLPKIEINIPSEQSFGAGIGRLIPFMEEILSILPNWKFLVIIDEFEDLDPAFYTGERGRLFVKALRSLSEIGLTFFFVGSERMNTIYKSHAADLNKWVNISLDCIESKEDCKALVAKPVADAIEYQTKSIDFIIDYCGRNPFYINLLCAELFKRCYHEQRTYVSDSDIKSVQQSLIMSLGITNFSHFWEDNPELGEEEKTKQTAENCLVLSCFCSLGGKIKTIDELFPAQDVLGLELSEQLSIQRFRKTIERLLTRKIFTSKHKNEVELNLPIFEDWLIEYGELSLLPKWREFVKKDSQKEELKASKVLHFETPFQISEDELLDISQRLVYCGKQKDVSELRIWLKQFDDDVRIDFAFSFLKRLAEKGFITEGAKIQTLERLQETLEENRLEIGDRVWQIVRGKRDNLCITYIDSEMKSGATTARELAKRLRPGKQGPPAEIGSWMKSHVDKDALVLIVDDFAGTGSTISKGLEKFFDQESNKTTTDIFLNEERILCYIMFCLPEALSKLRKKHPKVKFRPIKIFGENIKALDPNAGIFDNNNEINFAREMLIQIGRELTPQYPLGYGDIGTLISFNNTIPNNTLPIFWCSGTVNDKPWRPLFPRA